MLDYQDQNLADMHFEQQLKKTLIREAIEPVLEQGVREFYELGMAEKVSQIKPKLETIKANIHNKNVSDAQFREFIGTIIPQLLDRIC